MWDGGLVATDAEMSRARAMFVRVFGPEYGAELCGQLGEGYFNEVLMCRIAPQIWEAGEVALPTKILCAIVLLAAVNQDCSYFIRAAIYHGVPRRQVEEVLLLAGLEAGFPAAGVARRRIDAALEAHQTMLERLGRPRIAW
jgi:alkylhydroperoxidase/carboxymuconolactone decarboxylase family protein YurZ